MCEPQGVPSAGLTPVSTTGIHSGDGALGPAGSPLLCREKSWLVWSDLDWDQRWGRPRVCSPSRVNAVFLCSVDFCGFVAVLCASLDFGCSGCCSLFWVLAGASGKC